jgi:hypothetical protein
MALVMTLQSTAAVPVNNSAESVSVGPITITGTLAVPTYQSVNLASGLNTITLPTGTVSGCLVSPPTSNTQTLTLKGVTGDTGVKMPQASPFLILFDTANNPATFAITAGGATTGFTNFLFF